MARIAAAAVAVAALAAAGVTGTARRLVQILPDARLQLVQGAGHHLPRRAPDVVADAIVTFLATVDERNSPG